MFCKNLTKYFLIKNNNFNYKKYIFNIYGFRKSHQKSNHKKKTAHNSTGGKAPGKPKIN